MKKALTFDDVTIIPKYSELKSRTFCNTDTALSKNISLNIPIVASPMDTVTGYKMAATMSELGGIGFIHRFMTIEQQAKQVLKAIDLAKSENNKDPLVGAAVGVTGDFLERAQTLEKIGATVLILDVAHAHHLMTKKAMELLKNNINIDIIAGAVSSADAAKDLVSWGADGIRCGQGSGSLCETRIRAGVGIPQITCLLNSVQEINKSVPIMSDGGIRTPGDFAKAVGAGASTIMLGSLLAGTKETPFDIIRMGEWPNEQLYKKYRGSASLESKLARGEKNKNVEGNSKLIPYKGSVKRIINDLMDGLQSSMSYVGAHNIKEFHENVEFYEVTNAGILEAQPHLLK